jgi:sigma-E factor negative regulatory protein RseA
MMESDKASLNERLSGWVDGYDPSGRIGVMEEGDREHLETWSRYHLIGALMRGDCADRTVRMVQSGLADRVAGSLESEPAWTAPPPAERGVIRPGRWNDRYKGVAALALAAGVAAVAVIALRPADVPETGVATVDPHLARASQATQWSTVQPELANDLNSLLVEHGEFSAPSGLHGLMAYARFVSYDAQH